MHVSYIVFSFADMRRDVQEIFRMTPHEKQVMMFSATLSKEIRPVCKKFMQDVRMKSVQQPGHVRAAPSLAKWQHPPSLVPPVPWASVLGYLMWFLLDSSCSALCYEKLKTQLCPVVWRMAKSAMFVLSSKVIYPVLVCIVWEYFTVRIWWCVVTKQDISMKLEDISAKNF